MQACVHKHFLRGVLSIRLHNGPPPKTKIFEISLGPVQDIPEDPPDAFLRVLGQTVGELEPENPNRAVFGPFLGRFWQLFKRLPFPNG